MNSRVRMSYPETNQALEVQLVYPEIVGIKKKQT
jgi:hypothetical protein